MGFKKHIIFVEGNTWAQDIEFLSDLLEDRVCVSIHVYQPIDYVFQFVRQGKYPGVICGQKWDKNRIRRYLDRYYKFGRKNRVDIFVGEFGVNYRGNCDGEVNYLKDLLAVFDQYKFGSTYWTYKAVARSVFPDGVYQYIQNPPCLSRQGPVYGWENYYAHWARDKKSLVDCWKTENYKLNEDIAKLLKNYFSRK